MPALLLVKIPEFPSLSVSAFFYAFAASVFATYIAAGQDGNGFFAGLAAFFCVRIKELP